MSPRFRSWSLLAAWAILSSMLLLSAHRMYPVPDVDAAAFLPQAINLAQGRGLVNPMYDPAVATDPAGRGRQYFYPPLFQVTVAALLPEPTARGAFVAVALLDAATLLLSTLLLLAVGDAGAGATALACLALLGLTGQMGNAAGRPESLAGGLAVATTLIALRTKSPGPVPVTLMGVVLGLMGATHPVGGLMLAIAIAGYLAVRLPARRVAALLLLLVAVALPTFAGVVALSGTDLALLIRGLLKHARVAILPGREEVLWAYLIAGVRAPLLGVLWALAALAAADIWRAQRQRVASPWILTGAVVAASAATGYFVLRAPPRYYNLALFSPLAYAVVLYWLGWRFGRHTWTPARMAATAAAAIVFLGTGAGLVRRVLAYPFAMGQGRSWAEARADFRRLDAAGDTILVTHSLWVLATEYDRLRIEGNNQRPCRYGLYLQQQAASGLAHAPDLPGHAPVFSSFTPAEPRLLGLRLARTIGGYGFAAYRPAPAQRARGDCLPTR